MDYFVQVYCYKDKYGRGCICTIRSATEAALMMMKHGRYWYDMTGGNHFVGPFCLEEAKIYVSKAEYYKQIPA